MLIWVEYHPIRVAFTYPRLRANAVRHDVSVQSVIPSIIFMPLKGRAQKNKVESKETGIRTEG